MDPWFLDLKKLEGLLAAPGSPKLVPRQTRNARETTLKGGSMTATNKPTDQLSASNPAELYVLSGRFKNMLLTTANGFKVGARFVHISTLTAFCGWIDLGFVLD